MVLTLEHHLLNLFYPGHPLFQGLSHVLSRLPVILILSNPLGGLILPSFSWPVTLLLIHLTSPPLVKLFS